MKIGIVGCGMVGTTAAYALVMKGIGRQMVLVDINREKAEAEASDMRHAVPFAHEMQIRAGEYADLAGCRLVIIAAGVNQRPGESRIQLLERNAGIFREIIPSILRHAPDAILLNATNPVDIMTQIVAHFAGKSGVPSSRVIGSGTTLDTARFRALLSRHLDVDSQHVHAYVVGEHGDSEVLTWSLVNIGGIPLKDFVKMEGLTLNKKIRQEIDEKVRKAAYHIIEGKGSTYYGIGSALARIASAVINDQRAILTVCSPLDEIYGLKNVTIAVPHLVGGEGIINDLPLPLNKQESEDLRKSATLLKSHIDELNVFMDH